jgi:hypothetical protein
MRLSRQVREGSGAPHRRPLNDPLARHRKRGNSEILQTVSPLSPTRCSYSRLIKCFQVATRFTKALSAGRSIRSKGFSAPRFTASLSSACTHRERPRFELRPIILLSVMPNDSHALFPANSKRPRTSLSCDSQRLNPSPKRFSKIVQQKLSFENLRGRFPCLPRAGACRGSKCYGPEDPQTGSP